ncbi:MAG: T9SS type A sorting domain-containing protein [Ignavibacteriales bacterium]|nr:MAG: T9SS type A sorting domain-containing protein [Ignavibacteriales bacterium]
MRTSSQFFFFILFFTTLICAQTQLTPEESLQKNLDENGNIAGPISTENNYSILSLNWNSITNAMQPFGRSIGGQIGNYVYVFTGQNAGLLAMAYDLNTNSWDSSTVCLDPGYNSGFCVADGELYKISGTAAATTFEKFSPDGNGTGIWRVLVNPSANIMEAQNAIAWGGGDYIYAHCSNYSTTAPASYLERYSISTDTWSVLAPSPIIKRYGGLTYHNGFLYLVGGLVPDGQDQTACMKYEIATNTWSPIASLPEPVSFCKWTTTTVNNYIVLVGSGGGYTTYPSNPKVFYYDPSNNTWTYDGDVASERGLALSFYMPSQGKIFFGGGNMGGSSTNYQATCWTGDGGFIPVELISFNASVNDNTVLLNWATASERNNSHFEIQRSDDGTGYKTIGTVKGAGNTTETKYYSFIDNKLSTGKQYYRLKQIDFDGTFHFSNVVEVEINLLFNFDLGQNYPNPFNPSTKIIFMIPSNISGEISNVKLTVYDILGNIVTTLVDDQKPEGIYEVEFEASNLSSGTYVYKLQAGEFTQTRKMLLIK